MHRAKNCRNKKALQGRVESMQQSSATPSLHLCFSGLRKIVACSQPYLAVLSCIYSFWYGASLHLTSFLKSFTLVILYILIDTLDVYTQGLATALSNKLAGENVNKLRPYDDRDELGHLSVLHRLVTRPYIHQVELVVTLITFSDVDINMETTKKKTAFHLAVEVNVYIVGTHVCVCVSKHRASSFKVQRSECLVLELEMTALAPAASYHTKGLATRRVYTHAQVSTLLLLCLPAMAFINMEMIIISLCI